MRQLAESLRILATSSRGVNRPVDTAELLRSCEELKELLEGVVVHSGDPLREPSNWELARERMQAEIALQAGHRKPAMTEAVLASMDSFFQYTSFSLSSAQLTYCIGLCTSV
jgi:hypothetical protein